MTDEPRFEALPDAVPDENIPFGEGEYLFCRTTHGTGRLEPDSYEEAIGVKYCKYYADKPSVLISTCNPMNADHGSWNVAMNKQEVRTLVVKLLKLLQEFPD